MDNGNPKQPLEAAPGDEIFIPSGDVRFAVHDFGERGKSSTLWSYLVMASERTPELGHIWVSWWLLSVTSYEDDGHPLFMERGAISNMHILDAPADASPEWLVRHAEPLADGHFKADGCAEVWCDVHACTDEQWEGVLRNIASIRQLSQEHFGVPDEELSR